MYCAVSCILGIYEPFQQTGQGNDLAGILNPKSSAGRGVRIRQKEQKTGRGPYRKILIALKEREIILILQKTAPLLDREHRI